MADTVQQHSWSFHVSAMGAAGDIPVPGDYDGDGKTDLAVWRPSTGDWWVLLSNSGSVLSLNCGFMGDIPVPADYDGDGKTDAAVWRPSSGAWFILPSGTPGSVLSEVWGSNGDIPVPGNYTGTGKADLAVWRPFLGYSLIGSDSAPVPTQAPSLAQQWQLPGEIP